MNPLQLDLPENSVFTSRLYPSLDPGFLLEDLVVVELHNGIIIDAGWYPEHDPEGEYVVRVYSPNWSEQIGPAARARDPLAVREIVEGLAKNYTKDVVSDSKSTESIRCDFAEDETIASLTSIRC